MTKAVDPVLDVLAQAKSIAAQYYKLTGKPRGITGEVAEYEAARLLGINRNTLRKRLTDLGLDPETCVRRD